MKNLYSCLTVLFILSACSTEPERSDAELKVSPSMTATIAHRNSADMPANRDNPYDVVGQVHNDILYAYYDNWPLAVGVAAVKNRVMTIANAMPAFTAVKGINYQDMNVSTIESLLSNPNNCVAQTVGASVLSPAAKTSLTAFSNDFFDMMVNEDDYAIIYERICSYEATVLASALLTVQDQRAILMTTSIARYTAKPPKKKPKKNTDPDWTIWVGNLMGGLTGAQNDTADAIATAIITGIAQNPQ